MTRNVWLTGAAGATLIAIGACSSSSGGNAPPTCKNPSGTGDSSAACASCEESHCGSQLATYESKCQAYLSCYTGCDCSDSKCLQGCYGQMDPTCGQAATPFAACAVQSCASQCSAADAGGG
jgi:hypothetical protein